MSSTSHSPKTYKSLGLRTVSSFNQQANSNVARHQTNTNTNNSMTDTHKTTTCNKLKPDPSVLTLGYGLRPSKFYCTTHYTQLKRTIWSTGPKLWWSTGNRCDFPGGSKRQYISARKANMLWIGTRAAINSVTSTTAFLTRHRSVVSRTGRTEYQLLLMKASNWGRNVNFR